ncbi:MAG: ABC transporter ATP-binding protein [Myxococcota bacterium]
MSELALRLQGVTKRYGKTQALDGLDLEVPRGYLFGLVGPNGAGKTTTFGVVSGVVRPDSGTVDVLGQGAFDPARSAGRLTVLPQDAELNPHVPARSLLRFCARLQGLGRAKATREAERVLDLVQLRDRADAKVRQLSHGMRRRLAVAQALLGDPELVLLDEPTGGLDPQLIVEMRALLQREGRRRTLVVSTHILADLEQSCDHVAFLDAGRCVRSGSLEEVTRRSRLVRVRLGAPVELNETVQTQLAARALTLDGHELTYQIDEREDLAEVQRNVLRLLLECDVPVIEVRLGESLEDAYLASRHRAPSDRDDA